MAIASAAAAAGAQVVRDGSLGAGPRTLSGPAIEITPGYGRQVGSNLFHSFSRFDLPKGDVATFTGPSSISNVLTRVTGGSASTIDGTLRCSIPGADFYFINPAGVLFGPSAKLDVQGSFAVTTADAIRLEDGGVFDADAAAANVLTSAPPAAFGFVGTGLAGAVEVRGALPDGVVGDDVDAGIPRLTTDVDRSITVAAGTVKIISGRFAVDGEAAHLRVFAPGAPADLSLDPSVPARAPAPADGTAGGQVSLEVDGSLLAGGGSAVSVVAGGDLSLKIAGTISAVGGGAISVTAGRSVSLDTISRISSSGDADAGSVSGGLVSVNAGADLTLTDASGITSAGYFTDTGDFTAIGAGRTVKVSAGGDISLDESSIASSGREGGDVTVAADGNINLHSPPDLLSFASSISSSGFDGSRGGTVSVSAGNDIHLTGDRGSIDSSGDNAGTVLVSAGRDLTLIGERNRIESYGPSGAAAVTVGRDLTMQGRDVTIRAAGFDGPEGTTTAAGSVAINVGKSLTLREGAKIASSGLRYEPVSVTANSIVIDGADAEGVTGVVVEGGPGVTVFGPSIQLSAKAVRVLNGGAVAAATRSRDPAGGVRVAVDDVLEVSGLGSTISANSYVGGSPGELVIDAPDADVRVTDGATITAGNFRGGPTGGQVRLGARSLLLDGSAQITATGGGGIAHQLVIHFETTGESGPADAYLTGPTGTRVFLGEAPFSGFDTFQRDTFNGELDNPQLTPFVAADLEGTWSLELRSEPGFGPVALKGWSLEVDAGEFGEGRQTFESLTPLNGTTVKSPLAVSAVTALTRGVGGDIRIDADDVRVLGGSSISTAALGLDGAGSVSINARVIEISGGGTVVSNSIRPGDAGSVSAHAGDTLSLLGGQMGVNARRSTAGDLRLTAGQSIVLRDAEVTAQSAAGGGNVYLAAPRGIVLFDSRINATAAINTGAQVIVAGRLSPSEDGRPVAATAQSAFAVLGASSQINGVVTDSAGGIAQDKPVQISAEALILSSDSVILTDQPQFEAETDVAGQLQELPAGLGVAATLRELCGVRFGGNVSSFLVRGGGGLAAEPSGWLPSTPLPNVSYEAERREARLSSP